VRDAITSGKIGDVSASGLPPNLFYRWKDEAEQGAEAMLGGDALPRQTEIAFAS